ncbi:MAG: redoxin domain-containing protein [Alysiella sp.]|uniref:protein disulfide oxidoreductase n=1 Tax=Alysiella sp. TaxID=1872483 RepID=UPI0026DC03FC|nr:protein disulfide oxidoreductase [Alysiella sp.]MDO4434320.1 redoxin domain-containing protein [Alysiella sp.]
MKKKLKYWLKQITQTLAILLIVSVVMDWWRSPNAPMNAADVPFQTIYQNKNNTLANASANQTLVLYFWGTWCNICKHTSPAIEDLHANGVPVLGVAWGSGSDENIKHYLNNNHLKFDTINDENGQLSQQWGVKVTPTIILIKNGKVLHSTTGLASYWGLKTRLWLANLAH